MITQIGCTNCETAVTGYYPLTRFAQLSDENLTFLESFIRNRGNVKEMERETGQSYWTIRNRLDKVITEMGFEVPADKESLSARRKEILAQLKAGDINVDQATKLLSELGK